jgi:hypothetical protein
MSRFLSSLLRPAGRRRVALAAVIGVALLGVPAYGQSVFNYAGASTTHSMAMGDLYASRWVPKDDVLPESVVPVAWQELPTPLERVALWAPDELLGEPAVPPPPSEPGLAPAPTGAPTEAAGTEERPLGKAPEDNRLLFLRSATVLLAPGQWQFDWGLSYGMKEIFRPIVLPTLDLGEDRFRDRRLNVPFAARYGVSKRIQAFANAPLGLGMMDYTNGLVSTQDTVFGVSDVTLGVNYLLHHGQNGCPDVILTVDGMIPTGPLPFDPDITRGYLSDGFWSMGTHLLVIHTYDPVVVFYGVGYRHRFERGYLGGIVTPGEEINYSFGTGFAINDRVTFSTILLGSYQTEYQFNDTSIPGSSREPIALRFALTAFTGKCHIVEPFAIVGLTRDASDAQMGVIVTRTF